MKNENFRHGIRACIETKGYIPGRPGRTLSNIEAKRLGQKTLFFLFISKCVQCNVVLHQDGDRILLIYALSFISF